MHLISERPLTVVGSHFLMESDKVATQKKTRQKGFPNIQRSNVIEATLRLFVFICVYLRWDLTG